MPSWITLLGFDQREVIVIKNSAQFKMQLFRCFLSGHVVESLDLRDRFLDAYHFQLEMCIPSHALHVIP